MPLMALVVDDSMLIRHTVCRFLEERGFEVESASDGLQALEMLAKIQPDLIITDLQMPNMNGSDLITALKAGKRTSRIPIVLLASKQGGRNGSEKRVDFAIHKDIDIQDQLAKALEVTLGASLSKNHDK
jgi:two-component system, chemotaxis family, chemotaxis protein CheY